MKRKTIVYWAILIVVLSFFPLQVSASEKNDENNPELISLMNDVNKQLAEKGLGIAVEKIELYTIGKGRPGARIHQTGTRWVANDPRRLADGDKITYLVDQSDGTTASGLTNTQTEAAIDRSMNTWKSNKCIKKLDIVKRTDTGADPDILDGIFGFGGIGNPFLADIVEAGWLPKAYFDAVGGSGGGDHILAFSADFIFIDRNGNPTDINGDNYLDTALNEVYYNNNFGDPTGTRPSNPWGINILLPGIDVETVSLHENGHSLGIGHFGPPPSAVMNPIYAGIRHSTYPIDDAGMCTVWASWPK